ncbi:hypothetical protein [Agreia sp.]|uniref:hypothetical protein n=1 Tax=Agreia sp. TaxID=1872416 RepID=UPI0035BBD254
MPPIDEVLPPYDGPRGILHADRHDVAARLFVATFLRQKTSSLPRVDFEIVGLWERASIAARYGDKVVVLEPGMRILVSSEPSAAADRAMARVGPAA